MPTCTPNACIIGPFGWRCLPTETSPRRALAKVAEGPGALVILQSASGSYQRRRSQKACWFKMPWRPDWHSSEALNISCSHRVSFCCRPSWGFAKTPRRLSILALVIFGINQINQARNFRVAVGRRGWHCSREMLLCPHANPASTSTHSLSGKHRDGGTEYHNQRDSREL